MQQDLEQLLKNYGSATVAVSGGVDSMTLAYAANRVLAKSATMVHAVSPAVPAIATKRVQEYAEKYAWQLRVIDANEFSDNRYLNNPTNRCFFCKSNLYEALSTIGMGDVMSGTNVDDLSDWRPGLKAAENFSVHHPYVEVGMNKADVRALADYYGLSDISALPASPCLSSRIETGIMIDKETLSFVDRVEQLVRKKLAPATVRCRIRANEIVVSLDEMALANLTAERTEKLSMEIKSIHGGLLGKPLRFGAYKQGEAFLR